MGDAWRWALGVGAACVATSWALYWWSGQRASSILDQRVQAHRADFPVPFPVEAAEAEREAPASDVVRDRDLSPDALAREQAITRAKHLIESRYGCGECHGADMGGGVMVDDPLFGRIRGPNLTEGRGSVTVGYTAADWDRAVRHGIRRDGGVSMMPADEYQRMADQDLSDIVVYIRSLPPVDRELQPSVELGPMGRALVASGEMVPAALGGVKDHFAEHAMRPPPAAVNAEFGAYIGSVCTGCHREGMEGGPIRQGPPDWAPASNLTPGGPLAAYTLEDFQRVMRQGVRPDGSVVKLPMAMVIKQGSRMTPTELEALWVYLRALPASPDGS